VCTQSGESAMGLSHYPDRQSALEFSVTMPLMTAFRDDPPTVVTGTLRGVDSATQGHERECHVKVTMRYYMADQSPAAFRSDRVRADIVDSDQFPDGDYEVEFLDGQKEQFRRTDGRYWGRV
jgi:hypothetical protein